MRLFGLLPEPPFGAGSWSGSARPFFTALQRRGALAGAAEVPLAGAADVWFKATAVGWPMERWRARYHARVGKFRVRTRALRAIVADAPPHDGLLQIGAWFSGPDVTDKPCFSYHDGNSALWYRMYGRGLLSQAEVDRHLAWERDLYARLDGIFVMSQWLGRSFVEDFGVPQAKVHVVGAGINFDALPQVPDRDFSRPTFLLVGRDLERKGGRFLIEAFKTVRARHPDARLVIVGPDARPTEDGVEFAGFLNKSKPAELARLQALFREATAMVLPSIFEPFGVSLIEGMAYGLPAIGVDRCAFPEIVQHGKTGLIAKAENAPSLAEAMLEIAADPDRAKAWGIAGRRRVEADYTWDAVAAKIATRTAEIAANRPNQTAA